MMTDYLYQLKMVDSEMVVYGNASQKIEIKPPNQFSEKPNIGVKPKSNTTKMSSANNYTQ